MLVDSFVSNEKMRSQISLGNVINVWICDRIEVIKRLMVSKSLHKLSIPSWQAEEYHFHGSVHVRKDRNQYFSEINDSPMSKFCRQQWECHSTRSAPIQSCSTWPFLVWKTDINPLINPSIAQLWVAKSQNFCSNVTYAHNWLHITMFI